MVEISIHFGMEKTCSVCKESLFPFKRSYDFLLDDGEIWENVVTAMEDDGWVLGEEFIGGDTDGWCACPDCLDGVQADAS